MRRFILFSLILALVALPRVISLDTLPPTIAGDEVTNLSDIYKIIFDNKLYLFTLMGDGSVFGFNFYWMALFVKILGLDNTIFALRLSIAILSILSIIPFYFLLKERTSSFIATIFSILLSCNYVFLNFSRTAWINMGIVFSTLWLLLFIEKMNKENKITWYILAGISAGITMYGYQLGRIFIISLLLYLICSLVKKSKESLIYVNRFCIFILFLLITSLPFFFNIIGDKTNLEKVLMRAKATNAFSTDKTVTRSADYILRHQIEYVLKGFIFLEKKIMNEGIENMRYVPPNSAPVNTAIQILFICAFFYIIIYQKKITALWVLFGTILVTQMASDSPPNFLRGILYIPFIYLTCGILLNDIIKYIKTHTVLLYKLSISGIIIASIFIFIHDTKVYFTWVKTIDNYNARQPAIDISEFAVWQNYQIKRVKSGLNPVTNYEWYEIRGNINTISN
ncbi:MAG: glycosyltransferase family 39 protein [Candidatus Levybacteria bacterium]|nr:glycosyltransferase family 39 protein [Candidatus Levybacteria bacterium]